MSGEFLPLPMAAAVAYLRLVSHEHRGPASEGLLDVVASALSVWVPLYGGTPRVRQRPGKVEQHPRPKGGPSEIRNISAAKSCCDWPGHRQIHSWAVPGLPAKAW